MRRLPSFAFSPRTCRSFPSTSKAVPTWVFRHRLPNGLFQCIAVQRDFKSHGMAPNLAVTYSPVWRGESAVPLGIDRGFPNFARRNKWFRRSDYWYLYDPTPAGLLSDALQMILADFHALAVPFFGQAETELLGDKLLQTALREASAIPFERACWPCWGSRQSWVHRSKVRAPGLPRSARSHPSGLDERCLEGAQAMDKPPCLRHSCFRLATVHAT